MPFASVCSLALALALPSPAPRLFEPAPPPLLDEPEQARKPFELVTSLGAGLPEQAYAAEHRLPAGSELGLLALYRATPYFAAGFALRLNHFPFLPESDGSANALFGGAVGRLYFYERGAIEPYFELALGVSSLTAESGAGSRHTRDEAGLVAAARGAAGIDFYVSENVRVGPSLGYTRYASGAVERCSSLGCTSFSRDYADLPVSVLGAGLSLTFGAGDPL